MFPRLLVSIAAVLFLSGPAAVHVAAQHEEQQYEPVTHDCALRPAKGATDTLPEPPEWNDPRLDTRAGREAIVAAAAKAAISHLRDCGEDSFLAAVGAKAHNGIFEWTAENGSVAYDAVWNWDVTSHFSLKWTATIKYVQVQKKPDVAARSTCIGINSWIPPQPSLMPAQFSERFEAMIEVFPAVFERGQFLIPAEADSKEPWALDAEEAITLVLLHELGHLEAYVTGKGKIMGVEARERGADYFQLPLVDTEQAADHFSSTVVRCQTRSD